MEPECETTLPAESVKVIAESIGIKNLTDNAAKDLAEEVSYRLKQILQVNFILFTILFSSKNFYLMILL